MNKHQLKEALIAHGGNPTQVNRYVNYVLAAHQKNLNENTEYTERHHILPRADDMFPQYALFSQHPWNKAILTAKQHVIAHILLYKAFPHVKACVTPCFYMLNVQNADVCPSSGRVIDMWVKVRYATAMREEYFRQMKGRMYYANQDGEFVGYLKKDDPRIETENLKFYITPAKIESALNASKVANQMRIGTKIYNDGKIQKRFKTDPGAPWVLGELPKHWEDKRIEACKGAIKGGSTWNDGVKNYRLAAGEKPEPHWVRGLLRTKTNSKPSASIGKTTWNDGEKSFMVGPDEEIQPHWKRGLLRKPKQ